MADVSCKEELRGPQVLTMRPSPKGTEVSLEELLRKAYYKTAI